MKKVPRCCGIFIIQLALYSLRSYCEKGFLKNEEILRGLEPSSVQLVIFGHLWVIRSKFSKSSLSLLSSEMLSCSTLVWRDNVPLWKPACSKGFITKIALAAPAIHISILISLICSTGTVRLDGEAVHYYFEVRSRSVITLAVAVRIYITQKKGCNIW